MFSKTARISMTVLVALAVVLSMVAGPVAAAQDDGLLGGDGSDDGGDIVDDSGVSVGTDGVSVGGDEGINASTDGVSVAGQEVGPDTVSGGGDSSSLPDGDSAPIGTDGSNVEVGGDSGVSAGPDGVSVAGQEVGSGELPGADGLPGGDVAPGGGSGDVPTGPVPLDISMHERPGLGNLVTVQSTDDAPGPTIDALLFAGPHKDSVRTVPRLELSDADRTYIDLDGDGRVTRSGLENADGAIYTINESGGTYLLALSRDRIQARGIGTAQDEKVGLANVKNTPGTQRGIAAGGLFPAAIAGLGPSAPVGPEAPEALGGGVSCTDERCLSGTSGINETIPSNQVTDPVKRNYPFPRSMDTSGTVLPCSKPIRSSDLPADRLPGISDLPNTGAGLPTSLLTNDAVLGLAIGVTPDPCEVSDPLADPVANPATEPGSGVSPTLDPGDGTPDTSDGARVVRNFEVGPGGNLGTADGISAVVLTRERQVGIAELDASNSEYEYILVDTRGEQEDDTATGTFDTSLREGYAGLGGDLENELGTGTGTAGLRVSVVGRSGGVSISCTPDGCQPGYEGLPKIGDAPTLPNPLAGEIGLPA